MSAIMPATRTISPKRALAVTLLCAAAAMIAGPNGPLGGFWRPTPTVAPPTGALLPLFVLLNIAEALAFGLGMTFLLFGYPLVRSFAPVSAGLARGAHLSIAWLLINWWPHDSLHLHVGLNLGQLIVIEYLFHITLMIAGVLLAYFFLTLFRRPN
jgi:hypothetical protein